MDFLLVFALSLDTFFAAVACGADKIRIPFRSSLVMASVGTGCLALSLLLRGLLEQILPYDWIRLAGFVLLFLLGITALFQAGIKAALSRRAQKKEPLTFTCFNWSCVLSVYADETRADWDHSKTLSPREALLLAIPLSADSLVTGLSIAPSPLKIAALLLFSFFLGCAASGAGAVAGRRAAAASRRDLSWLSGVLLVLIAFAKVL